MTSVLKFNFFKSLQFFQGRIILITFGWGTLGAETLCLSGVKICQWNTLGGNLGGQVENVCPLGAEKGQSLPSSALRNGVNYNLPTWPNIQSLRLIRAWPLLATLHSCTVRLHWFHSARGHFLQLLWSNSSPYHTQA